MSDLFGAPASVIVRGFPVDLTHLIEEFVEQWNGDEGDTLALIAQFASGLSGVSHAQIIELTTRKLIISVAADEGPLNVAMDFEEEVGSIAELQAVLMGLLRRARESVGRDLPKTGLEREIARTRDLPTFVTRVLRSQSVSPLIREVTFGGGLENFVSIGPDQFVYVLAEKIGQKGLIREGVTMAQLVSGREADRPAAAYYTVRRHRPDTGELDLWFVLHEHATGISGWAERVQPGDSAAFWGPRSSFDQPEGTTDLLLFGDETAFPAIAAILESSDNPAHVVVETVDETHKIELSDRPDVRIDWLFRYDTPAPQSTQLLDGVRRACSQWSSGTYAFGAAEATPIKEVRRYLRQLGAGPKDLKLVPYWNSQRALNP